MSTDVPRFSRFRLLNALYAGVMAGVMAGPLFIPQFRAVFDEIIMALGMIWAVRCSSLSFPVACSTSWVVLLACLMGAAIIAVVMPLTTVICSGTFNLYVCAIITLPFSFAVSVAAPCNKCKLVQLYDYKTVLTVVYLGLFFAKGDLRLRVVSVLAVSAWSTLVPLLLTTALNALRALPRGAPPPMPVFEGAAASYLETCVMFILEGELHQEELERKRDCLSEARRNLLRSTTCADLEFTVFRMSSLLYTLRRSSRFTPFNTVAVKHLWVHLERDLFQMVSAMIAILRREDSPMESAQLRERSQDIARKIRDRIIKYTRGVANGNADLIPVRELIRLEHVMLSITRLAKVVADYSEVKLKVITENEFHLENLIPVHPLLWRLSAWIKEPLYPADTTWFEGLWFPVRLTVSLTILTLSILGTAEDYPDLQAEGFWILMPGISCFLSTVGSTLSTGVRRLLGVIVGGVLAIIATSVHPDNEAAFIVEIFLVASATRFLVVDSTIGYAGMQMFITFIVVAVVNGIDPEIAPTTRISMAAVRMLYTVIGLTATLMLSLLTVPIFICRELSCRTADEIRALGEVVVHGITALTESAEAGSSPRYADADLGSVVSTGNLILQKETARAAATSGAEEENTLLRLVSVNASRCQISAGRIISAQRHVMRVSRCSMSVCISLERCMHSIGATARKNLLLPAREALDGVATAMLKSSIELEALLRGRSAAARVIEVTEELVRAMGVALTHFEDLHRELLFSKTWAIDGDVMESTKLVEALSSGGGVGLHEGLYALTSFVAEWLALVNALLGCSITVSPPREHETRMKRFVKTTTSARARSRAYSEQLGAGKLDE